MQKTTNDNTLTNKSNKSKTINAAKTSAQSIAKSTAVKKSTKPKATPKISVQKVHKVLYAASEATPFIASGGLADVAGSLPAALKAVAGADIRVILPLYTQMKRDKASLNFIGSIYVNLSWRRQYCGVFSEIYNGITYYFIDNEYYFNRPTMYGDFDDAERFAFFSKAVLEVLPLIDFYPDILHTNDWHTALIPIYLQTLYHNAEKYRDIKTIFTIHNIEYQGVFDRIIAGDIFGLGLDALPLLEYNGAINLMKGAIVASNIFTTVSPTYAQEIKSAQFAKGLEHIILQNADKLVGILNGIDVKSYNSKTDKALFANFTANDLDGKAICKKELQSMLNLPLRQDVPVVAMITRLAGHKGIELVERVIEDILKEDVQFIILGTGDSHYESFFADIARRYSAKMAVVLSFNSDLARKIYSGADLFLMPSKTEPCGLSQMIASRYGTVPIVRETGGLFDSIKPYGAGGNGFTFKNYNAHDMLYVIKQAIMLYNDKAEFNALVKKAITHDFSWEISAHKYIELYNSLSK